MEFSRLTEEGFPGSEKSIELFSYGSSQHLEEFKRDIDDIKFIDQLEKEKRRWIEILTIHLELSNEKICQHWSFYHSYINDCACLFKSNERIFLFMTLSPSISCRIFFSSFLSFSSNNYWIEWLLLALIQRCQIFVESFNYSLNVAEKVEEFFFLLRSEWWW